MATRPGYRRGRYGIDAPFVPVMLALCGLFCVAMAIVWSMGPVPIGYGPAWLAALGLAILALVASFLYTSLRGKFGAWAQVLDGLRLKGDERVLDLGCGRGLVLLEAARRLDTGRAVGIDRWRRADQSGNGQQAAQANARIEGVEDRVELHTGDITALPFEDAAFDLVVSNLVLHNLRLEHRRLQALDEAVRVLRPGGQLLIADVRHTQQYRERLQDLGFQDVARIYLGWRCWYGGPVWATRLVWASKPAQ